MSRRRAVRPSAAAILILILVDAVFAAERKWQTGTCVDVGIKRTPLVGGAGGSGSPAGGSLRPPLTEVATWAIETEETRFEMQDVVPIGSGGSVQVAVGRTMTFAIDGRKTATIKAADGTTFRVLITRQTPRKKP